MEHRRTEALVIDPEPAPQQFLVGGIVCWSCPAQLERLVSQSNPFSKPRFDFTSRILSVERPLSREKGTQLIFGSYKLFQCDDKSEFAEWERKRLTKHTMRFSVAGFLTMWIAALSWARYLSGNQISLLDQLLIGCTEFSLFVVVTYLTISQLGDGWMNAMKTRSLNTSVIVLIESFAVLTLGVWGLFNLQFDMLYFDSASMSQIFICGARIYNQFDRLRPCSTDSAISTKTRTNPEFLQSAFRFLIRSNLLLYFASLCSFLYRGINNLALLKLAFIAPLALCPCIFISFASGRRISIVSVLLAVFSFNSIALWLTASSLLTPQRLATLELSLAASLLLLKMVITFNFQEEGERV